MKTQLQIDTLKIDKTFVGDLAGDLLDAAKKAIKVGSPSKRFADEFGKPIPQGAAQGIMAGLPTLSSAMNKMLAGVDPAVLRGASARLSPTITTAMAESAAGSAGQGGGMTIGDINVSLSGTPINSMLDTKVVGREVAKEVMTELRYQRRRG